MSNLHDRLVREVFSDPQEMQRLLCSALPAEMAAEIQWSTLKLVPGTFVDEGLREHQADLLFTVTMGQEEVLLYILFEHKSTSERDTVCQLLRYLSRIWEHWQQAYPGKPLPPVLPYVLHHGPKPWSGPRRLHERIDFAGLSPIAAGFLRSLMPDLGFVLDDVAAQGEEAVAARSLGVLGLLAILFLANSRGRTVAELESALRRWFGYMSQLLDLRGPDRLVMLFSYFCRTTKAKLERVGAVLGEARDGRIKEALMTTADRLHKEGHIQGWAEGRAEGRVEGRAEGRVEGRAEGRVEGRAAIVLQLLDKRFGPLTPEQEARVRSASEAELRRWTDAVLDARTLQEVLGPDR
jgi:predicted transposase YdaD